MFTRSVISFAGKSAFLFTLLPGVLFAAQPKPQQSAAKKHAKAPILRSVAPMKHGALRQQKKSGKVVETKAQRTNAATVATHKPRHAEKKKGQTRALGAFTLRAYTQYLESNGGPVKTATGTEPTSGRTVAVDPRVIPFGSKIYIEGLGERVAEDTGAAIKGNQIDVFLPSVEHCLRFGVQKREVMVVIK